MPETRPFLLPLVIRKIPENGAPFVRNGLFPEIFPGMAVSGGKIGMTEPNGCALFPVVSLKMNLTEL